MSPDAPLLASTHVSWLMQLLASAGLETAFQMTYVAGPFFLVGLALHRLRALSQQRLRARFGWYGVLFTAWLGAPIHEGSHALACLVFRHRIRRIAFFAPDPTSGVLGYVHHSYDARSVYQVVGNFFIGVAPFLGGALALYGLLWLFDPSAARQALGTEGVGLAAASGRLVDAALQIGEGVGQLLTRLFTLDNLRTPRFWGFLYVVLCVGSHLAPSPEDYNGARAGGLLLLALLFLANAAFLAGGGAGGAITTGLAGLLGPVFALLIVALALSGVTTALIVLVIALWPR